MATGKELKQLIHQKGYSQRQIARELCINPATLSQFLNGYTMNLRKSKYIRLCYMLGIDVLF